MLVIDDKKQLDYQKPNDIALAACRLRALACAADILMTDDSPLPDSKRLESESMGSYLLGLACEIANEITEAADLYSAQKFARERSNKGDA